MVIAIDDLRASIGAYGDPHALTPNLDRLAAEGALFERAYAQQAVCSASRASVLTGLRPSRTTVDYPYNRAFRDVISQENPTFPSWFESAGAWSRMAGKVHHDSPKRIEANLDSVPASRVDPQATYIDYAVPENAALAREYLENQRQRVEPNPVLLPPTEAADVGDEGYLDGRNTALANRWISEYAEQARSAEAAGTPAEPLVLNLGLMKPHLPFNAPKRYWGLYDRNELPDHRTEAAEGLPGWTSATFELGSRYTTREAAQSLPFDDATAAELTHGYYACVSYADAMVGSVLATLEAEGLADDTLVAVWSDHGFHLGENRMWGKHVNYEVATRSPLLLRGPGVPAGRRVARPVELLDLYPTLCDLLGVEPPPHLQGRSLVPVLRAEPGADPAAADAAAVSEYPRGSKHGWALRDANFRHVRWIENGRVVVEELYDHRTDPGETRNLAAADPARAAAMAARLRELDLDAPAVAAAGPGSGGQR